ncbi:MAG TPA: (2Fe-2S)-binding protein [Anaerolineae bacterium]|nr:(2Fe-2S)-binding protein [Anaerolineae bacterium]HIQ05060.1 (2Fe-2S)-binding protein [Anaerolineae bacterium]
MRVEPSPEAQRGQAVTVIIDGVPVQAYLGETIAAVLLAQGRRAWRRTAKAGQPRGLFCGMGICFDCLVTVDGRPNVRACVTPVTEGMVVQTQPDPEVPA